LCTHEWPFSLLFMRVIRQMLHVQTMIDDGLARAMRISLWQIKKCAHRLTPN
jgi:hypothetical protein